MRTIGNIALFTWLGLIVFSIVLAIVKKGKLYRWLFKHRREFQLVILTLMITWIMLLSLSVLFKID